jgi:isocitrate dehydrogenase
MKTPITIAYGDGIGPEIMEATLRVLDAAGARLAYERIEIGEKVYLRGVTSGIEESAWESLRRTKVFFKAPITTPQGKGYKSLNVTTRKTLGLYANVRPVKAYHPYVDTNFPEMDLVIVRENEEDLYAGIEHRQTDEVYQCLKIVSRPGCEKIVRYAFEYARNNNRDKVTCLTKDNIMKLTDGLFHKVFDEVGAEYPEIEKEHRIIDIGSALIADQPDRFEIIVTLNLYGDIISDIAAEVGGSVGLGGSANIGDACAMFEAIHGSAPDIAGKDIANPSGLLNSAIMMLVHVGQPDVAEKIHNAWLVTLEDGMHTGDVYTEGYSKEKVGTKRFADDVIKRLGGNPKKFKPVAYPRNVAQSSTWRYQRSAPAKKEIVGVDLFLHWVDGDANKLGAQLEQLNTGALKLQGISNRGVMVYPHGSPETFCTDHWSCRYIGNSPVRHNDVIELMAKLGNAGLDVIKMETLCTFDGVRAYSLGQGE